MVDFYGFHVDFYARPGNPWIRNVESVIVMEWWDLYKISMVIGSLLSRVGMILQVVAISLCHPGAIQAGKDGVADAADAEDATVAAVASAGVDQALVVGGWWLVEKSCEKLDEPSTNHTNPLKIGEDIWLLFVLVGCFSK